VIRAEILDRWERDAGAYNVYHDNKLH
jgi:hypothetical protein